MPRERDNTFKSPKHTILVFATNTPHLSHIALLKTCTWLQDRGLISPRNYVYETHFSLTAHLITTDYLLTLFNGLFGPQTSSTNALADTKHASYPREDCPEMCGHKPHKLNGGARLLYKIPGCFMLCQCVFPTVILTMLLGMSNNCENARHFPAFDQLLLSPLIAPPLQHVCFSPFRSG